jgi:hypothetical protein
MLSPECDPMTAVAPGGSVECRAAFETPNLARGTTLNYDDGHGDTATAAMPPPT